MRCHFIYGPVKAASETGTGNHIFGVGFIGLVAGLVAALPVLAADRVVAGLYESGPTNDRETVCLTVGEAKAINGGEKEMREWVSVDSAGNCKLTRYEALGPKVTQTVTCGPLATTTSTVYQPGSFVFTVSTVAGSIKSVQMEGVVAKRTGSCK